MDFYQVFLPITTFLFFVLVFVIRSFIVWKQTSVNPFVFKKSDKAHDYIGGVYKVMVLFIWISIIFYSFFPKLYFYLVPISYLEDDVVKITGAILIIIAFVWTAIAQYQMAGSWRIGINYSEKTVLVKNGLFKYSRNPVFLGVLVSYLGVFLISPNALSLSVLLVTFVTIQTQVRLEEEFLVESVGQEYSTYKTEVNRWLF